MSKKKCLLALAISIALTNSSYAGAAYAAENEQETEQVQTRDVVVTASRTEQEIKDTPVAVEVVTREDLDRMGAENLAQALQLAVGIDVSENGMVGNSVSIRGAKSNQTLILVDGMRIRTENTDQTANNYELQRINMADVERVEIVRGSASSIYGADAMGGVINIITKSPDKESKSVFWDWTTRQTDAGFRVATGALGKWSSSVSYRRSDIHHMDVHGGSNQYGPKDYFNIASKYKLDDKKSLGFFLDYMKEDLYMDSDLTSYEHDRAKFGISYDGRDKRGSYQLRLNYTMFDKDQNTRKNGVLTGFDELKFRTLTFDGQRSMQLNDKHLLTFGGEVRRESYEGTRIGSGGDNVHTVTREGVSQPYSEKTTTYSALYAQDEWMVDDKWLLIPSLRFDHNSAFGNKMTYKLGNTFYISDNTRLKLNLGTAYRAPTEAELYMNWEHTPVSTPGMRMEVHVKGNPDLKPETSYNFDIGLEAENNHGGSGKVTYFHSKYSDLIALKSTSVFTPGMPMTMVVTSMYENINTAEIQGVEAEYKQKLGKYFTLRGTYAYTDAKDGDGARLEGRDRQKFSLQLNYDDGEHGWSGSLWNDWHRDYLGDAGDGLKNHSVSVLNCVVSKKLSNNSNAYFGVNNILGKDDETAYTVFGLTGRVWRAGMTWNF
ncbi:TonB-dependent receptor plug domain-containing protein [Anaerovibrio sp.]|uniref:TonB-dependent receptor plug domain-containing protein n=1 Tax=Anaerovibrio sp. TaxID=1872532 RepID=UPI003F143F28